jgi:hypothetical protein
MIEFEVTVLFSFEVDFLKKYFLIFLKTLKQSKRMAPAVFVFTF